MLGIFASVRQDLQNILKCTAYSFSILKDEQMSFVPKLIFMISMKKAGRMALVLSFIGNTAFSQTSVTKVYTDFQGFWSTDSVGKFPNASHNLLGLRVDTGSRAVIYSTGVNDPLLRTKGLSFIPMNYKAVPVRLGARSNSSTTNYYIGVGSNFNGVTQGAATSPIAGFADPAKFLTSGVQGLDLGSALFNIPDKLSGGTVKTGVSYEVDQFNVSRIGDSIPDIIVTQVGDFSGTADVFRFVDANGNTVGNTLASSFPGSLGIAYWSFYRVHDGSYPAAQPGNPADNNRNPRDIRVLQWDLKAFGLNASNVGNVVRFVHDLGGNSDPAFIAYNTSSFRTLGEIQPACAVAPRVPVWLQADRGASVNGWGQLIAWKNDGDNTSNAEQSDPGIAPVYHPTATGTNYRPFMRFSPGTILHQVNTSFTPQGNFDIYVVARPTSNSGSHKIVGFKRNGASSSNFASLWLTATGALEFRDSTNLATPVILTGASPGVNNLAYWKISYTRGGQLSISMNDDAAVVAATAVTIDLPTYHTEYGDAGSSFDLSEIMFFNNNLSVQESSRISSYFALKYGITHNSDLVSGDNNVVWDQDNGGFNYRIFGVGREDCMGISQRQTHSSTGEQAGTDIIQIGLEAMAESNKANVGLMADGHYIIWGDNGGTLNGNNNVRSQQHCLIAPERKWRAQATGNIAGSFGTQVKIKTSDIWSTLTDATDYYLLIDRNGNGRYDDEVDTAIQASNMNDDTAVFNGVLWDTDRSGSDLFTIGLLQASPDAGPDQTATSASFTLNASPSNGRWTITSVQPASATVVIADPLLFNTAVTVPGATTATLRWSVDGLGGDCYDQVVLRNNAQVPLPVSMGDFNAVAKGNTALLTWTTLIEQHNAGFAVERSADAKIFEPIGFVEGSNRPAQYEFSDHIPLNGINYYRVRQIDLDGQNSLSEVRQLRFDEVTTLLVVPNPVSHSFDIKGLSAEDKVVIYDATGKIMYQGTQKQLNVADWTSGLYLIKTIKDGRSRSLRFIKQ